MSHSSSVQQDQQDIRPASPIDVPPLPKKKHIRRKRIPKKKNTENKLKFFGIKWRFLRSDLEKESLPVLPKRPIPGTDSASMTTIAQSAVLDTYVKNLQMTGVSDLESLQSYDYSSVVPVSHTIVSEQSKPCDFSDNQFQSEVSTCSKKSSAQSVADSELTEADVLLALQNMKIFQNANNITPVRPLKNNILVERDSIKEHNFVPKPPSTSKPSYLKKNSSVVLSEGSCTSRTTTTSNRGSSFRRHRQTSDVGFANLTPAEKQEKLRKLPICEVFKQYALDNGFRVPKCVAKASTTTD